MNNADTNCPRERLLLDLGWKFHRGDIPTEKVQGHGYTYGTAKAGKALSAARVDYPDDTWQDVNLPHDWVVGGTFDPNENLSHGYLVRGEGWYRRTFRLEPADAGKVLSLEFDGVGTHCTVWLNGHLVYRNWCGYTSFVIDITDVATFGDDINVLAVRVDAKPFEGWWYEGAGIYRHAWLVKTVPLHVERWGTFVNPVKTSDTEWTVNIETSLFNRTAVDKSCNLQQRIIDPTGAPVAEVASPAKVSARDKSTIKQEATIRQPQLWSPATPWLYTLITQIIENGTVIDEYRTPFGFRTIEFSADKGFFLNGEPVKLKGTCNHQDHAGVGVAVPDSVWEYRIRRLQAMGCNAYRCAHNPPAPEFLDACDRLGMLVMDENRNFDSSDEGLRQLESMILRDRNHPSIIMWSIFNEEPLQGTDRGRRIAETMLNTGRRLDASRPFTAAMNGGVFEEGVAQIVDVAGFNYFPGNYDSYHELHPGQPMVASETAATTTTRGIYEADAERGYRVAYDTMHENWGSTARNAWKQVSIRPFVAGTFVWTGFDYRGEPTPLTWPCINSHFGIIDTCGFPKDAFYLYQAMWTDEPMVHVLPHWNWGGREGQTVKVCGYSNCDSIELFLNDRSLGEQKIDPYVQAEWDVPYEAGTLRAEARRGGKTVATKIVNTTGRAVGLRLEPSKPHLNADAEDVSLIEVTAIDADGNPVPDAADLVTFAIEGAGRIIGVGNGDPSCHESDKANFRSLFNGHCMAVVQATATSGTITLRAALKGGNAESTTSTTIECLPAERRPYVESAGSARAIKGWRVSPVTAEPQDPNAEIADNDMNSWEPVEVGKGPHVAFQQKPGYAVFRAAPNVPRFDPANRKANIVFMEITGEAEIYVKGVRQAVKQSSAPAQVEFELSDCSPGESIMISVMVRSDGKIGGITGAVAFQIV